MFTNTKGEIDSNTIIVGDFNLPLASMDRPSRQSINKEILTLNDILDQIVLIDIYKTFYLKTEEYTFSSAYRTFSRIDHILGHNTSFYKFKKIEFSFPNTMT